MEAMPGEEPTILRPPGDGRGNTGGGAVLAVFGFGFLAMAVLVPMTPAESPLRVLLLIGAAAVLAYGTLLFVRARKVGVALYSDRVVVTRQFGSTTVPRAAIEDVVPYTTIVWRDVNGRKRRTQANALSVWRSLDDATPTVRADVIRKVQVLSDWAHAGGNAFSSTPPSADRTPH